MDSESPSRRVLYVITKANWGGAQKYVFDLATAARERGFNIAVAYGENGLLVEKLHEHEIHTISVPALGRDVRLGSDVKSFFALRKLFEQERPEVVHLNSSKAGVVGALAARMAGVRTIIFTAHGWAFNEDRPLWQKLVFKLLQWLCVVLSHKTICVSEAIRNDARWMPFAQRKLLLIYNGVAEPQFITRAEARTFLSRSTSIPQHTWIGTVAELHPNKRLDLLIEAFAQIASEFPDTALVIMGEGQERKNLQDLISKQELDDRIHLLGHISDAPTYLKALDLFVLPSHTEAFSLSILEAGFATLPVIASNVGGIPEIIDDGKNGILFERGNVEELMAALKKLLADPALRERFGTVLREKVEQEFSLKKMIEQTLQLYGG